jgi:glycyl-tRNA synthetase (class II)
MCWYCIYNYLIKGHADRSAYDLTAHSKDSKVSL